MNNHEWLNDIQWQDLERPTEDIRGEEMYTVYMVDFLKMPEMNFLELAVVDPAIRALLN